MPLSLRYAARSDVGLVREGNEDSGYAGPRLLAVADGMGGHAAGEVASSVALSALAPLDDDDEGGDLLDALANAVGAAQESIGRAVDAQPELEGMGTTLTALLWSGNRIGLAHVGDSRAYLLRGDELVQLTRDHTYVQSLVDSGRITADEAASHPRRSLLTRALGDGNLTDPDLSIREIRAGDRFLLCSDGLSAVVSESTLHEALTASTPPEAVDRLVDLALRGGGPDNITAIVADVVDLDDSSGAPEVETLVVGAAGLDNDQMPSLRTPAGRAAAALRPSTTGSGDGARDLARRTEDHARRGRWITRGVAAALLLVIGIGAIVGFNTWTRSQYFVGVYNGQVAIYRGIPQDLLGLSLSDVYEVQQVDVSTLPPAQQSNVTDTIHASNLDRARAVVTALEEASCTDATVPRCGNDAPDPAISPTLPTSTSSPGASPAASSTPAPSGSAASNGAVLDTEVSQP